MPSLYDAHRRDELVRRLDRLEPERSPAWGRFTAPQMVAHLTEAFRMASGELRIRLRPVPLRPLVRLVLIHFIPFPKSAPTARELLARVPTTWAGDLAHLRERIDAVRAPTPGSELATHPLFGRMSARDWGVLMYKHTDHHFRQFGI